MVSDKLCQLDFSNGFVFDPDCLRSYAAKTIGTLILAGAIALKVPQMYNIYATKDVVGLSPEAFYSDVPLSTVSVVYNILQGNPFTSYGEGVVIGVQNFILVLLLWAYMKPAPSSNTMVSVLTLFAAVTLCAFCLPREYQYLLPLSTLPMMVYSRFSQILSSYKHGTTGQLSLITTFLQLGGSLARIYTTIVEVGWDMSLLSVCALSTVLNGILMAQVGARPFRVLCLCIPMILVHLTVPCFLLPHSTDYLLQLHQERSRESIAQEEGLISSGL
jgi:hypothetical protein